jgi:hypothetical protein
MIESLTSIFKNEPWFHSVAFDQYQRPVVYVHERSAKVLACIPNEYMGKQVLVHFASSIKPFVEGFQPSTDWHARVHTIGKHAKDNNEDI